MDKSPVDIIKKMREILTPEGAWTKGMLARNALGYKTDPLSPRACSWCLYGAFYRAVDGADENLSHQTNTLLRTGFPTSVASYNDHSSTTQADVLARLDRLIEREQ